MLSVDIVEMLVFRQEQDLGRNIPSTLGGGKHRDEEGEDSDLISGVNIF